MAEILRGAPALRQLAADIRAEPWPERVFTWEVVILALEHAADTIDAAIGKRPPYHVIELDDDGCALQHEAECFPDLLACPIHRIVSAFMDRLDPPGLPPGRYRLTAAGTIATGDDGYPVEVGPGTCRVCGCTDDRACTPPCSWVEPDLCSACREGDSDG